MKLTVPYTKITEIIKQKTGQNITVSKNNSKSIRIGYDLVVDLPFIGERTKHFDIDATLNNIIGTDVYLSLNEGISRLANVALFFTNIQSLVEKYDGGFILHLNGIDGLRSVLNTVIVQDLTFSYDEIELEFDVKI